MKGEGKGIMLRVSLLSPGPALRRGQSRVKDYGRDPLEGEITVKYRNYN